MRLNICRGNLHEPFLDSPDFQTLLGAIDESRVIDKSVLEDELYVIGRGGISGSFVRLLGTGKRTNPDHSHVAYATGITDVKPPCEPELDFDRGRTEAADADIDIQADRRDEVKGHAARFFGEDKVASIATYSTFSGKGIIRDAARVYQVPLGDVNKALKNINASDEFIEDFVKSSEGGKFARKYPEVIKLAKQLRGKIRGRGMHAAGLVISNVPLSDLVPIESTKTAGAKDRIPLVALDKDQIEEIGLIKIDFLGLNALTIIDETLKLIKETTDKDIDIDALTFDDANIYNMLSEGKTKGVFQCEAAPYTKLIKDMGGVQEFNDLAASNALVRPGAFNTIGKQYIMCKKGEKRAKPLHEDMAEFTKDTYYQILYQEQVMQTLVAIGGFSEAEADKIRKIIGKKKDASYFDEYKEKFIRNASEKITTRQAEKLWKDFEAHSGYSFNKSHAVAYSMVSYWTAWLKYYYPQQFIVANLRHEGEIAGRTEFLIEATRMGLEIKMPHVNKSGIGYTIEGKNAIRIGLSDIKYVSENAAEVLIKNRTFVSYAHLYKFTMEKGNGLTTRTLHGLNAVGAAEFYDNPLTGDEESNMYEYMGMPSFNDLNWPQHYVEQTTSLAEFDEDGAGLIKAMVTDIRRGEGWALVDFVDDSGTLGVFDDEDTQMQKGEIYMALVAGKRIAQAVTLSDLEENGILKIFLDNDDFGQLEEDQYFVLSFKKRVTKAGKPMAHVALVDRYRNIHAAMVFPQNFAKARVHMKEGTLCRAGLQQTEDGSNFVGDIRVG